jgi:DHA1 family quinolone resistance protein-like MFS transporter
MTRKKLLFVYTLNQTFHWFIVGLLIPVMALLQLEKGLDLFQIGITMAVYSGTVILLELPTGGLADAIGRKRVYLISLVMSFLSGFVILVAWNFYTMAVGTLLMGVARALSSGTMDAWFVDEFNKIEPEGNLQEALAKVGTFIPGGLGVGSLIGGLLPMSLGKITSQVPGFGVYSANLITIGILVIVQFLLTSILVVEHLHPDRSSDIWSGFKQTPEVISTSMQYGLKNRVILMLLVSALAWGLGLSGLENLWQPQVKDILGSDSQTWIFGLLSTGYFLAGSLGYILITPVCKLFNNNYPKVLFGTRLLMGTFFFLLALQGSLVGFAVFYLTLFVFNGMSNPPHAAIFNAQVPEAKRSTLMSFESFFLQIGGLLGSLVMGYIANTVSISTAWFVGAGILSVSSLVYFFLPVRRSQPDRLAI